MKSFPIKIVFLGALIVGVLVFAYFKIPEFLDLNYSQTDSLRAHVPATGETVLSILRPRPKVTHMETPEPVKAVYMTSWTAANKERRGQIVRLIDETELNSIVIDIKDYSGKIAFDVYDPYLKEIGSVEKRIPDIFDFIGELHDKNIYVIGRISVFQDPYLTEKLPDLAVKRASDGEIWRDKKGLSWFDPGAHEIWDYAVAIGREAYNIGFDELNFDYIRFPSDGDISDIYYPVSKNRVKSEVILNFFAYLDENLKDPSIYKGQVPILSVDLFGMTVTNMDDLNIGQFFEYTLPYFDYISPMVYPSHFPRTWRGITNPAEKPYEVIKYSMDRAIERMESIGYNPLKLRPWLQDFNLGAIYTKDMVRAQIQATYDSGLTSWMLWDPANTYTTGALLTDNI